MLQHLTATIDLDAVLRLIAAAAAGAFVGLERFLHGRPAGARTNMLVCLGAALVMIVSREHYLFNGIWDPEIIRIDPARIAAGVVVGVGFLGAGVIIKGRNAVVGLTTAATIWLVAGIGLTFGAGLYGTAAIATVGALALLRLLGRVEKLARAPFYRVLRVDGAGIVGRIADIEAILHRRGITIKACDFRTDREAQHEQIDFFLKWRREFSIPELLDDLRALDGTKTVALRQHVTED